MRVNAGSMSSHGDHSRHRWKSTSNALTAARDAGIVVSRVTSNSPVPAMAPSSASIVQEWILRAHVGHLVGGHVVQEDLLPRRVRGTQRAPERPHDRAVARVVEPTAAADPIDAHDERLVLDGPGLQQGAPVV